VPLSVVVTAANANDTTMFQAVVEDIHRSVRRLGGGGPTGQGSR
jgi:hypothetical protein